jgi:uncharacterized lipoprotein YmbA
MKQQPRGLAILILCMLACLIDCRMPGGDSPPTRYWLLEPVDGRPADADVRIVVGVGPFDFPAYLERSEYVQRVGTRQVLVSRFDRWAQALDHNFTRVVSHNLEVLAPGVMTPTYPWEGRADIDYRLQGVVTSFEVVDDAAALLTLSWTLTRTSDDQVVARSRWSEREPVVHDAAAGAPGVDAGVAALSRALGSWSRQVAASLEALD